MIITALSYPVRVQAAKTGVRPALEAPGKKDPQGFFLLTIAKICIREPRSGEAISAPIEKALCQFS
jgi:hypothetical protein